MSLLLKLLLFLFPFYRCTQKHLQGLTHLSKGHLTPNGRNSSTCLHCLKILSSFQFRIILESHWNLLPRINANSLLILTPEDVKSRNKCLDSLSLPNALHSNMLCIDVLFLVIFDIAAQHLFYAKASLQTLHCQFDLLKVGRNTFYAFSKHSSEKKTTISNEHLKVQRDAESVF